MKQMLTAVLLAPVLSVTAHADTCPAAPDHGPAIERLIDAAQTVDNEDEARGISSALWALWADAPNEQAQAMLDRGMARRAVYDFLGAMEDFNALVAYCPDYAEGYNQRAFVNFLTQNFAPALVDLDEALDRSPRHIAALAGKALTLLALNRADEARPVMAEALRLNPWLPERGLAAPGGPLAPLGEDI